MNVRFITMFIIAALIVLLPTVSASAETNEDKNSENTDTVVKETDLLISEAKKLIGVSYSYGGTSPKGFDCSGFSQYVFEKIEVEIPRSTSEQYKFAKEVDLESIQVGDLVFFETYKPGPSHVGIYIGDKKFIHSSSSKGVTISNLNDPYYWQSRFLGAKSILNK